MSSIDNTTPQQKVHVDVHHIPFASNRTVLWYNSSSEATRGLTPVLVGTAPSKGKEALADRHQLIAETRRFARLSHAATVNEPNVHPSPTTVSRPSEPSRQHEADAEVTIGGQPASSLQSQTEAEPVRIGWLVGRPSARDRWRLYGADMIVEPANDDDKTETIESVLSKDDTRRSKDVDNELILSTQSEVLFVVNAILGGPAYDEAWRIAMNEQLLPKLSELFDDAFRPSDERPTRRSGGPTVYNGTVTSAIYGSSESDDHRHDNETLRKLELLRTVHEYCHAQDLTEVDKLLHSSKDFKDHMATLVGKITHHLLTVPDDPCTETVACHVLEVYHRCFALLSKRPEGNEVLIKHILTRMYNATTEVDSPTSLLPSKRHDALMALLGESLKWSKANWKFLYSCVVNDTTPFALLTHEQSGLTVARNDGDTLADVLRTRIVHFPDEANLFLRGVLLNAMRVFFPMNYIHRPRESRVEGTLPINTTAKFERREMEKQSTQLRRMVRIRELSRAAVIAISEVKDEDSVGTLLVQLLDNLGALPNEYGPNGAPFGDLFDVADREFISDREAYLTPLTGASATELNATKLSVAMLFSSDVNEEVREKDAELTARLVPDRVAALRALSSSKSLDPETMDGVDKLCVITTSLLVCAHEHWKDPKQGLRNLLRSASAQGRTVVTAKNDVREQLRCFGVEGVCETTARWREHFRGTFAATYFRQVCVWLGHYSSCQRYVETLYMCSGIAFGEWKYMALAVLKELAQYLERPDASNT